MRQEQGEPVDAFISRLKKTSYKMSISRQRRSQRQSFGSAHLGVKHPDVQKSPISRDNSLTLAATIATARSHEATSKHMKTLAGTSESHQEDGSIDAIRKEQKKEFCNNLGKHLRNKCPAYSTSC